MSEPGPPNIQRYKMLKHQIRMEVVAKSGTKNLDVGNLLHELMIRSNEKETVEFQDVHGESFDTIHFPEANEFVTRLAVDKVETARSTKVTLGLYILSSAPMQHIKLSIGFSWLAQQQIYLRTQRMPFQHGTDLYLMGQMILVNPSVANPLEVEKYISNKR